MGTDILSRPAPTDAERLVYGPEALQFGDLRLPEGDGPHPVVVVIHGGFWRAQYDLTHAGHLCAALTRQGSATWNVEYRRVGDDGGGWPGTFLDVSCATDHVRELAAQFPLDLRRVIVLGHSAGGHLALWLAARHRLASTTPVSTLNPIPLTGAVALAGMPDLTQAWELRLGGGIVKALLGGTPALCPDRYAASSPITVLPLGVPHILVHGSGDRTVPLIASQRYVTRARALGDDVRLITLQNTGHFELIDPESRQWPEVEKAIVDVLQMSSPFHPAVRREIDNF